jgi:hypothetical protein
MWNYVSNVDSTKAEYVEYIVSHWHDCRSIREKPQPRFSGISLDSLAFQRTVEKESSEASQENLGWGLSRIGRIPFGGIATPATESQRFPPKCSDHGARNKRSGDLPRRGRGGPPAASWWWLTASGAIRSGQRGQPAGWWLSAGAASRWPAWSANAATIVACSFKIEVSPCHDCSQTAQCDRGQVSEMIGSPMPRLRSARAMVAVSQGRDLSVLT